MEIASPNATDPMVEKAVMSAAPLVRLSRVLARLADELASGRQGPAYSLLGDGDGSSDAHGEASTPNSAPRRILIMTLLSSTIT